MANVVSDWMCRHALPLWSADGWDPDAETFVERLDLAGTPLHDVPRRVMVQARQIFVFCAAHEQGWWPEGGERAARAGRSLVAKFQADGLPGWAFAVDRRGTVVDGRRDLYAQAFVLLAFAALARLDGDRQWLAQADATLAFLDARMAVAGSGGYAECEPRQEGVRRQNPHMHLLEALLALHEADVTRGYMARADKLADLFETRFLCGAPPVLVEYFEPDWSPRGGPAFSFEPGHHFEWAWLLDRQRRLGGRDSRDRCAALWRSALSLGVGPDGRVYDEVRADGTVLKSSTRLWAVAEAAKAATCGLGDESHRNCGDFLATLHAAFLAPAPAGSWIDHLSPNGEAAVRFAPASSLYHICGAAQEAERCDRGMAQRGRPPV